MRSYKRPAPVVPVFQRFLKTFSLGRRRFFYQVLVFVLTFVAYTTYHVNKRPFSDVKSVLSPQCNVTIINNTCHPWKPFSGGRQDKTLLGLLDFSFMIAYSVSLFGSGYIAENTNLRIFLSSGMFLTAVSSALFGLGYYGNIHSLSFFFIMQVLAGITQSTGLPAVTEAVGMWIPHEKTGLIYGIWSFHSFFGNIIGNEVSGALLVYGWGAPFLFAALLMALNGSVVYTILVPHPSDVDMSIGGSSEETTSEDHPNSTLPLMAADNEDDSNHVIGISLSNAFRIPGVLEYAFCAFFTKLVLYTFFFWLPYIIKVLTHADPTSAAYRTSIYDVGCGVGGIVAGIIYDYTDKPALINVVMLTGGAPMMILLFQNGTRPILFSLYTFLSGCFLGGPFVLLTSTLAKRLSMHHFDTAPNTKAIAVLTAIFDGFGSFGASIGPLLTGVIEASSGSWTNVSYFLVVCVLLAATMLSRQCYREILGIVSNCTKRKDSVFGEKHENQEYEKLMDNTDE